jgi:hypothetical protein
VQRRNRVCSDEHSQRNVLATTMKRLKLGRETIALLTGGQLRRVVGGLTVTDGTCLTRNNPCTWADCPTVQYCD